MKDKVEVTHKGRKYEEVRRAPLSSVVLISIYKEHKPKATDFSVEFIKYDLYYISKAWYLLPKKVSPVRDGFMITLKEIYY